MAVLNKHCLQFSSLLLLLFLLVLNATHCHGKYVEGRLKTLEVSAKQTSQMENSISLWIGDVHVSF